METRTVKMNLLDLISSFLFATNSNDSEMLEACKSQFERFYNVQSNSIKESSLNYILNHKVVKENSKILNYFKNFEN